MLFINDNLNDIYYTSTSATQSTIFVKQFNNMLNVIDTQSLKISGLKIV